MAHIPGMKLINIFVKIINYVHLVNKPILCHWSGNPLPRPESDWKNLKISPNCKRQRVTSVSLTWMLCSVDWSGVSCTYGEEDTEAGDWYMAWPTAGGSSTGPWAVA